MSRRLVNLPSWLVFVVGMMLGSVLTSTFTFRFWWCPYDSLSVDRETLSIVQVNEHIHSGRLLNSDNCVCGESVQRLKEALLHCQQHEGGTKLPSDLGLGKLDELSQQQSISETEAEKRPHFNPLKTPDSPDGLSSYLQHPNITYNSLSLNEGYQKKQLLLVAVATTIKALERASTIYDSWGLDVDQILFFVGDDNTSFFEAARGMPIVRLPGISDTPSHSVQKTFAMLRYLHDNYINDFHWFMRVNDDIYVRGIQMKALLEGMDPTSRVLLGRGVTGRENDAAILQLLPGENYCMGGPGVVLSSATLQALSPKLDLCLGGVEQHNRESAQQWTHYDVELGRCANRVLGVQCSNSAEAHSYFVHGYQAVPLSPDSLKSYPNLITYHSVPDSSSMQMLHQYFKTVDFKAAVKHAELLATGVNDLCGDPDSFSSHGTGDCGVSLCPPAPKPVNKCSPSGVVSNPSKSFPAASRFDYQSWEFFDGMQLYNDRTITPAHSLKACRDRRHELQIMLGKVVQAASEEHGRHLRFKKLINGYVRHNPVRGSEYIVDAQFTDFKNPKVAIETRVNLLRPLATNYIPLPDNNNVDTTVNFIVPMSNVNERFKSFMQNYESAVLALGGKANLILSVYGTEDVEYVKSVLQPYYDTYPTAKMIVIEGKDQFSRSKALNLGMMQLRSEDLAFLCDVDMDFDPQFLNRCRRNTIQGSRVYYPEFFKLYNMDYVYYKRKKPESFIIKRSHGHWTFYSFGMLCIYKSDYHAVGGLNTDIVGWGEEDVNFFERVLRRRIEVLRAPDTALRHRWHEKFCSTSLTEKQYKHCLSSRGENLADRIELATYIYNSGSSIKSTLSDTALPGNYSQWTDGGFDEEEEEREAGEGQEGESLGV